MREDHWPGEAEFFDRQAANRLQRVRPPDPRTLARYAGRRRRRFAPEFRLLTVGSLEGKRVVDVGCGEGQDAVLLARLGAAEVVGVDLSAQAIAVARRRAELAGVGDRVDFVCAPVETARLPERAFDVVWCNAILHHVLDNLDEVLARLASWAAPGGVVSFAEPVSESRALRRLRRLLPTAQEVTADERPLEPADLARLRRHLPDLALRRFGLLGRLDRFVLAGCCSYEGSSWPRRAFANVTAAADRVLLALPGLARLGSSAVMWGHPRA